MEVSRALLFFFSALGAFNGLILGLYFIIKSKDKHISNQFLGWLLIMLSVRIGKSVFFYFNEELSYEYIHIGLTACALIGPFLYLFLKSIHLPKSRTQQEVWVHISVVLIIMLILRIKHPYHLNYESWQETVIPLIYYQWLGYLLVGAYIIREKFAKLFNRFEKISNFEFWILSLYIGNFIIWVAYKTWFYASYIVGALSFSFIFYILVLLIIFNKKRVSINFNDHEKYSDKKIQPKLAQKIESQLITVMSEKEVYRNPNLKLADLAHEIEIPLHQLSQFLNDNLKKGFPLFINEYRINAAKNMILTNEEYTLEGIGRDCGFNSNSTFYTTFKKLTGTTPAQFKKSQQNV